jgi:putative pyoverdin transport system ATP-binding/permease protein
MKLFPFILRYSWPLVILAILVGVIAGASSAALMALINAKLDGGRSSNGSLLWLMAGLVMIVFISSLGSRIVLNRLSQRAVFEIRMRLCRQVLAIHLRRLEEFGSERILAALTEDITSITGAIVNIPLFIINLTLVLACLVYLGWLSLLMLGILSVFFFVSVVSIEMLDKKTRHFSMLARHEWDRLLKHFRALMDGSKELKLHRLRREAFFSQLLEPTAKSHNRYWLASRDFESACASWNQSLFFSLIILILFCLPYVSDTSAQALTRYAVTVLFIIGPMSRLVEAIPLFSRAAVSLKKIEDLGLSLSTSVTDVNLTAAKTESPLSWKRLDALGITHTYYWERGDRNFTLGPIDLAFYPGELVFLIGGNGSGKTTLAKLLTGLYTPEIGEIQIDGKSITDENRDHYRQYFSVIFSEICIFERLIGLDQPNLDSRAHKYLVDLQLDHKVEIKDGEFSTTQLSAGQRKRLALLTAYLEDRPIYIFDEWAADQDPVFKNLFYYQFLPELKLKGKMILAISHDDRYYHLADRIIKLEGGKIEYDTYNHIKVASQFKLHDPLDVRR